MSWWAPSVAALATTTRRVLGAAVPGIAVLSLAVPPSAARAGAAAGTSIDAPTLPGPVVEALVVEGPVVEGPLPAADFGDPAAELVADTAPWLAAGPELELAGYVEEEFVLRGSAGRYATRVLVRRPVRLAEFSGTVLVEWQNSDAGFDLDAIWRSSVDHLTARGHAWVGVSASPAGVDHLRGWSPTRYGSLVLDPDAAATSFDEAATALLQAHGLLGDFRPAQLLAVGARGAAAALTVYANDAGIDSEDPPYFDGYAFVVGPAPVLDVGAPVIHVLSELDVTTVRPRVDDERYRRWEVAGSAPVSILVELGADVALLRDIGPERVSLPVCEAAAPSAVPGHHVVHGALDSLSRWAAGGTAATAAPRITRLDGGVVRDAIGNALGGVRLAAVEVPTATNTGVNAGEGLCPLLGSTEPLSQDTIAGLYPDHDDYVRASTFVTARNLERGFLTVEDATATMIATVRADIGRPQQSSSASE